MNLRRRIRLPLELNGNESDPLYFRLLMLGIRIVFYPAFLLIVAVDKFSGQESWCLKQVEYMEDRPSYADDQLEKELANRDLCLSTWKSARIGVSEAIGVRPDAIHPDDRLSDIMRMQFPLPDLMDFIFRLEKRLNIPIEIGEDELSLLLAPDSTFLDFVVSIDHVVRDKKDHRA